MMSCDPSVVSVCIMCRQPATSTFYSFPSLDDTPSGPGTPHSHASNSPSSHMPHHMGPIHSICNLCNLSNHSNNNNNNDNNTNTTSQHLKQTRQRHLRPSRTSHSAPQLSPLINKFAHRICKMSLSNLLLTLFLSIILCTSQVKCGGIFELRLDQFDNELNRDASGQCCGNSNATELVNERQICKEKCQTFFRVCFKNFQANIDAKLDDCNFGEQLTPALSAAQLPYHIIKLPFFSWPGTFSLIIEAWYNATSTSNAPAKYDKTRILIGRYFEKRSNWLAVGSTWTSRVVSQQNQTTLAFSYRVNCEAKYYGESCSTKCSPQNGTYGHYNCGSNGERICHSGWTNGSTNYCQKPVCRSCNETNGECIGPDICRCRMGWQGPDCNQCTVYPGCQHGYCIKSMQCICNVGWGGLLCTEDLNFCTHNKPCKNGGLCSNTGAGSFTCSCPAGFKGQRCEIEEDVCENSKCQNGATCRPHDNKSHHTSRNYTCECPLNYSGAYCEQHVSACTNNPCGNGGTCRDSSNGFQCLCKRGFSGVKCETTQKKCRPNLCQNGGTCRNSSSSLSGEAEYLCECLNGFRGDHCEENIDDCASNPCLNSGTCMDEMNTFRCRCAPGFTGPLCENNVDECKMKPCANGGICLDQVNDYKCVCPAGYTGKDCSTEINECASNPCLNGGHCQDLINDFSCRCASNFYGTRCEKSNITQKSAWDRVPDEPQGELTVGQLALIILVGFVACSILGTFAMLCACQHLKRHDTKKRSRRDEAEARRQNEHNAAKSTLNNKGLDQCLNPSAANVIVNAFDRTSSLHHLNKCHQYQSKVTNEYVYGRHFDKSATLQHDYKASNKLLNSEAQQVKVVLDDPYDSHTYEQIQKPSNLLSCHLSNQQLYQAHAPKQSNLEIYSCTAAVSTLKSDCPPAMPRRPKDYDYGHSHDLSGKLQHHSNVQNNIQIAASLHRIGCMRPATVYIDSHYSQPLYSDPKKLQATEV